jgi:hypothetical protein
MPGDNERERHHEVMHPFVETERITGLITDTGMPDEEVLAWKANGVPVQRVPPEPAP